MNKKDNLKSEESDLIVSESIERKEENSVDITDKEHIKATVLVEAPSSDDQEDDSDIFDKDVTVREIASGLEVRRKLVTSFKSKSGKDCYNYFVKGAIRGTPMAFSLGLKQGEITGYNMLDACFNGGPKTELYLRHNVFKDSKTGRKIQSWRYVVKFFYSDGKEEERTMFPRTSSDGDGILITLRDKGFDVSL